MSRLLALLALARCSPAPPKPPRPNRPVPSPSRPSGGSKQVPFADRADFERAERGLIRRPGGYSSATPTAASPGSSVATTSSSTASLATASIPACNARPCSISSTACSRVAEGIYQVRGFDLASITFIRGDSGWIVVDT
ncbi:hypothetical protein P4114_02450 [Pseudomonas aeruginosa]|nr:hypothetical protein [Pseudomonas aeruginosa]